MSDTGVQSPNSISMTTNSSMSMSMRAQKKVLSKLSRRGIVRFFANERVASLMDTLFALLKNHYDQKTAEKVVKNIIKLTFKLGAMERENVLSHGQLHILNEIERRLRRLSMDIQSFQSIHYSYNQSFIREMLIHLQHTTRSLVDQTLSEKSGRRVDHVFEHLKSEKFLASLAPAFPGFQRISNANDENVHIEEQHNKFVGLVQNFITLLADLLDYNNNGIRTESESQEIK